MLGVIENRWIVDGPWSQFSGEQKYHKKGRKEGRERGKVKERERGREEEEKERNEWSL